jgi:hypothetical protein
MKIRISDIDEEYIIETFDISNYDLDNENDVEILKQTIFDTIESYIEENM